MSGEDGDGNAPNGNDQDNLNDSQTRFLPGIRPPGNIDLSASKEDNWKIWKQQWQNYAIVSRLNKQPQDYRTAMLLNCIGTEALKVYNGFTFEAEPTVDAVIEKFDQHIIGTVNETYERYKFNSRQQAIDESFDAYLTTLRCLKKSCNFCQCLGDTLLRDRIVTGIRDDEVRKKLLEVQDLTLKRCVDICRAYEATGARMKLMAGKSTTSEVHGIQDHKKKKHSQEPRSDKDKTGKDGEKKFHPRCKFCGRSHEMKKESCPAWGKTCTACNGRNHFQNVCKKKSRKDRANAIQQQMSDSDTDSEYELINGVKVVHAVKGTDNLIYTKMLVEGKLTKFQVDCGASVNLINHNRIGNVKMEPPSRTLQMWDNSLKKPVGECQLKIVNPENKKKYLVKFVVVKEGNLMPILGATASQQMGLITVNTQNFSQVNTIVPRLSDMVHDCPILNKYAEVFGNDVGHLPGKVTLQVDESVRPVVTQPRRVPVSLKAAVKEELDRMTMQKIIAPVTAPTDWVSAMAVATKRSGSLRICVDPKSLNQALKREHFPLPTLEDILPELSKARIISTADLRAGYWHVELDDQSSYLTTFATPFGRYRWLRLPFGLSVSSEIFAKKLYSCVQDLEGVVCVADDLMIFGIGDTDGEALADHDRKLEKLLQRCHEVGIRLNPEKMKLRQKSVPFLGHVITSEGLKPDPAKVEAVLKLQQPNDVEGVQRLNGFVNYLAKFLPGLSDAMGPIRELTRKDVPWQWSTEQENALSQVQLLVSESPVLRYYDPGKELTIQCDASQSGLGAALLQEGQPVAYASRALTETEARYAQIEKEMLAIVWSLEKFNQYTFGRETNVMSDHKPLQSIMKKPLASAPKRLQGMLMRLQKYNICLTYTPGNRMHLADTLSRAYQQTTEGPHHEFENVHAAKYVAITEARLDALRAAMEADPIMSVLKHTILEGWPNEKHQTPLEIHPYFSFRDELAVHDGLVFKGERVVIPKSQRQTMREKIHSSHLGIDGCLRRARDSIFWPNMTAEIREYISTCETCRMYETANAKELLMSHDIPDRPWAKVGTDLFSYDGKDYLITVDYLSNFWEVDMLPSTESIPVIQKLKNHFARYGIPDAIVSDNGPQFTSREFRKFCNDWDITHYTSSPYNSKANGKAESAVKTVKRIMRKCKESRSDPYLAILDHRNTPTQGMTTSPAQRLMSRRTKTLLPTAVTQLKPAVISTDVMRHDIKHSQRKQAEHANKKASVLPPLEEGDTVRLQPFKIGDKKWTKGTVVQRLDERSYFIDTPGGMVRRNRQHIKKSAEGTGTKSVETSQLDASIKVPEETLPEDNSSESTQMWNTESSNVMPSVTKTPKAPKTSEPVADDPVQPQVPRTTRSGRPIKTPLRYQ